MPGRLIPFITKEIYHVFNRGIDRCPTFTTKREYARALDTLKYYQFKNPPVKLSKFLTMQDERKQEIMKMMINNEKLVKIYSYCLMPNHFHLLLMQNTENGISKFLSNFQNSYTRYFNTRHDRDGSLLLDQFKGVRIETDEQFMHVSRYIHLNPYTSYVVKKLEDLENYSWSSLPEYLYNQERAVEKDFLLSFFKNTKDYKQFVFDQADYQRKLNAIKHLVLE